MKKEIHELLHKLADDSEIPEEPSVFVSDASRQKVDEIVEKMNQEQTTVSDMPKPVYDKPPKHKRVVTTPEPISHFSETPSQSPVVRMHDRLLEGAMPQPDTERRPTKIIQPKSKAHKKKKKNTVQTKPKRKFQVEIKEELPPDIPRDTTVTDRIRQEKLEAALASAPPKTLEDIRKEQVQERAAKIRQMMRQQQEAQNPPPEPQVPPAEPEEEIPAWEEQLSEFSERSETESSEQLKVFDGADKLESPVLSELPEISRKEDTTLTEISRKLEGVVLDEPEAEETPLQIPESQPEPISGPETKRKIKKKKKKKMGFIRRIALFWERILKKNRIRRRNKLNQKKKKQKQITDVPEQPENAELPESSVPAPFQPPPKISEVLMESRPEIPNLDFTATVTLQAVPPAVRQKKKAVVRRVKRTLHEQEKML